MSKCLGWDLHPGLVRLKHASVLLDHQGLVIGAQGIEPRRLAYQASGLIKSSRTTSARPREGWNYEHGYSIHSDFLC